MKRQGEANAPPCGEGRPAMHAMARQFGAFFGVGLVAATLHYGLLIGLVELGGVDPVRASLIGYLIGGIASYALNRRLTYGSDRPHREAGWRFAVVAAIGFCLTWIIMAILVRGVGAPYLPAQIVTTGIVLFWTFLANKFWTFQPVKAAR